MTLKIGSSFSCLVASVSSPFQSRRSSQVMILVMFGYSENLYSYFFQENEGSFYGYLLVGFRVFQ